MAIGAPNTSEFLKAVRELTEENGTILITDEGLNGSGLHLEEDKNILILMWQH